MNYNTHTCMAEICRVYILWVLIQDQDAQWMDMRLVTGWHDNIFDYQIKKIGAAYKQGS